LGIARSASAHLGRDRERLLEKAPSALPLAARLEAIVENLAWAGDADSPALAARRTVEAMEAVAADAAGDTGALWAGHGGEAMSRLLGGMIDAGGRLPDVSPRQFADLLKRTDGRGDDPQRRGHPSAPAILGSIEARLVRADRLVVAGLEEGVWPAAAPTDPFLSRPMREALGLPSPERPYRPRSPRLRPGRLCARGDPAAHRAPRRRAVCEVALALAPGDPCEGRRPGDPGADRGVGLGERAGRAGRLRARGAPLARGRLPPTGPTSCS
jgi:hypothetical protein